MPFATTRILEVLTKVDDQKRSIHAIALPIGAIIAIGIATNINTEVSTRPKETNKKERMCER